MDKVVVHAIVIPIIIIQEVPCAQNAITHGFYFYKMIVFSSKECNGVNLDNCIECSTDKFRKTVDSGYCYC